MLLTSVSGIREDLGFDDMTDINAAIGMALHAVEPQLAAALNTSFTRAEVTDTFWVPEPTVVDGGHVQTEFWLSWGLIVTTPAATAPGRDLTGAIKYNLDRGVARDWLTHYSREYVTFAYQAGFEADQANPEAYKLTQVPEWLQEAAKLKALIHLSSSQAVTEAGIQVDVDTLKGQFQALMNTHIRYAPMALYPL